MKYVHAPHLGHNVALGGRKRPITRGHALMLHQILRGLTLPNVLGQTTNYRAKAGPSLRNIYCNQEYGCCVIAEDYHRLGLWRDNASATGEQYQVPDGVIISDYSAIGGFDPNNPTTTDNGCDMETAVNYRVTHGYADGSRDLGHISVDASDARQVAIAFWLFEDAKFGMELPAAWLNPFPSADGAVWGVAGDPVDTNGHCVGGSDLDKDGLWIDSWGLFIKLTFEAMAKYAVSSAFGQLYVRLNEDQVAKAMMKAPNGVDWNQLLLYFNGMGGNVPVATPTPTPAPTPNAAPAGAPSLSEVTGWINKAFDDAGWMNTRTHYRNLIVAAMQRNWR